MEVVRSRDARAERIPPVPRPKLARAMDLARRRWNVEVSFEVNRLVSAHREKPGMMDRHEEWPFAGTLGSKLQHGSIRDQCIDSERGAQFAVSTRRSLLLACTNVDVHSVRMNEVQVF